MTDHITSEIHPDNYTITYRVIISNTVNNTLTVDIRDTQQCREIIQYFRQLANTPHNQISNINRIARSLQLMTLL